MLNQIEQLKKEKNAVILAHYYAPDEAQKVADYVGDSFYLAKIAKKTSADIIVFCGVLFMGESAKILNPEKKVLMPDPKADCPMAHMVAPGKIEQMKNEYNNLSVVCYINSTADLKCQSDVCVTSSNALKIVKSLPNKNIFFIPDRNLGSFVAQQVPEKNIILNDGFCPIHAAITKEQLQKIKNKFPAALVLTHPECKKDILQNSDFIGSTSEIIEFANKSDKKEFIVCTEYGVKYELSSSNPDKTFIFPEPLPSCTDMKLNTLQNILSVLKNENNEIKIDNETMIKANIPLDRMLECAK